MIESQKSIVDWADWTFGPTELIPSIRRSVREMQEFIILFEQMESDPDRHIFAQSIMKEMADVVITLYRVADKLNTSLHSEVDSKMQINRQRKWASNGDGTGQHIKE